MTDTNSTELFKYARLYLGTENWEFMKKTTPAELKMFQDTNVDIESSYFIKGNELILKKFKAFYLTRCLKKRPLYTQCSIYDYADGLSSADKDEFGLNVSKDLLFLYMHCHMTDLGRSRQWLTSTVVNKVADRNRIGLVTLILSEVNVPEFEDCGELKVIDFGGVITKAIMKNIETGKPSSSGGYE